VLQTLQGHRKNVRAVALFPDGRRAISASDDGTLKLWDLDLGECPPALDRHTDQVNAIALLANGRRVISASGDHTLKLWDLETGRCLQTLEGHTGTVLAVALSSDGRRAISGTSNMASSFGTSRQVSAFAHSKTSLIG